MQITGITNDEYIDIFRWNDIDTLKNPANTGDHRLFSLRDVARLWAAKMIRDHLSRKTRDIMKELK